MAGAGADAQETESNEEEIAWSRVLRLAERRRMLPVQTPIQYSLVTRALFFSPVCSQVWYSYVCTVGYVLYVGFENQKIGCKIE